MKQPHSQSLKHKARYLKNFPDYTPKREKTISLHTIPM